MKNVVENVVAWTMGVVLVVVLILAAFAHCSVGKQHNNSIGTVMYVDNPNTYLAGEYVNAVVVGDGKGVVMRVQPIGTYQLFTQDILLCTEGLPEKFLDKKSPFLLTYETQAHVLVEGLGCHRLVRVDNLEKEKKLP